MNMEKEILDELMNAHRSIIALLEQDITIPVLIGVREIQKNLLNKSKLTCSVMKSWFLLLKATS